MSLKHRTLQHIFQRYYSWRLGEFTDSQLLPLDYPVDPTPKYPFGGPPHPHLWPWFDRQRSACADTLRSIGSHRQQLEAIPDASANAQQPHWQNQWFSALDAMALYALVATKRPARMIEVGSGHSTKFARRAITDHGTGTHLTSIDPQPRAEIDSICDRVIRSPLERVDEALFNELQPGDFLFIDSSHRVFTNSDVTVLFLDVLPALAPGVFVHVHDIFLPWDYPVEWRGRYYSEQYMLACWLLGGSTRFELVMSNAFASLDPDLRQRANALFQGSRLAGMFTPASPPGSLTNALGGSFWVLTA